MSSAPRLNIGQPWQSEVTEETNSPVDSFCIGVGEALEPENILHLSTDLGFNHVCQKQGHEFNQEIESATTLIGNEQLFFEFPIATILSPQDLSLESESRLLSVDFKFTSSNQKREALDELTKASQARALSQTIVDDVIAVADEMFTNAVYNAPFIDVNTQKNPGIDRQTPDVHLGNGKVARLFMAQDDKRLIVGCMDPYGSLDLKRYLNKIKATYTRGPAATMNFGPGGAGIGSYIIFNAGASLYFGVWAGRATIITCVMPLGLSNRKRIQLPKHLHWIQR